MRPAAVRPAAEASAARPRPAAGGRALPAWPLLGLIWGYPVLWALGLSQFAPTVLCLLMLALLLLRGHLRVLPGLWAWGALLLWMLGSTAMLGSATDLIGWGMRFTVVLNAGICALYYANARETLGPDAVLRALSGLWAACVLLGCLGLAFPEARLSTPMGAIMPGGLMSNDLVHDYVAPRLTETQQPWGAPAPYIRPSAPFVYANSWGLAYALLTPVVVARLLRGARLRVVLWYAGLGALSVIPALASSNRGMFLGLGLCVLTVWIRAGLRGRWAAVAAGGLGLLAAGIALFASGAAGSVLARQEYSDSTGGRSALYRATWERSLESPLLGHGTTQMEPSVGVSLGTQGYLWTLLFCYGFVAAALFLWFLLGAVLRWARPVGTSGLWLHAVLVSCCLMFVFYSFDTMQMITLLLLTALLGRARLDGDPL